MEIQSDLSCRFIWSVNKVMIRPLMKSLRRCSAIALAVIMLLPLCPRALASGERRVLRVAFPQVEGLTQTGADGSRHGLVVDYLNEIAKYTGWEYEYVDTSAETMLNEFNEGAYDLMGGNYYSPSLEELYAYPDYNTGYSKSVLLARKDDHRLESYNLESLNGKTIGVYGNAKENIRRLQEFLTINNLDCTLKEYHFEQLSENGNLYPYLASGEVDMLLGNNSETDGDFRVVTSYDSQPYYIVTTIGNQEVLDGLNMALEKILDSNPNFGTERYEANFPDKLSADIQLNSEERTYIKEKGTVTVAVPADWHPLFCINNPEDLHDGLVPAILKEVSDFSGLKFSYLQADSYFDAVDLVLRGEADVLAFFLGSEADAAQQGLALTAPYVNMNSIVVRNKSSSFPSEGLVGAVIKGRRIPSDIQVTQLRTYASITEALFAVNRGEADFIYGLSARMEQEIQRNHLTNLVPVTLVNDSNGICFALTRPAKADLLTVLNKAVNNLSAREKNMILNQNLVSIGANQFSLTELIYSNPILFVSIVGFVLLILAAAVLLVTRARMKAAVIQSNLEKAQAESRAKGEFLSRMSHEIRTPMNAVVGLADLTSMLEGVPENVRKNLVKIRSSSQYLLSLINDILDMSRIGSGMLSIGSEPFSIDQMLEELQGMMQAEAGRHGLAFTMETQTEHSHLVGDVIRLRQVLTNLLSNAFKFTPEGGDVTLRVTETDSDGAQAAFMFQVIDNGIGIRPEDQQRIFDSFEQLGSSSSKSQGTGLGLSISRSIVQLMGGELGLSSEPGRGSEFYFSISLPLGTPDEETLPLTADGSLAGVRLLLAEDNDLNAEIAAQLLEMRGADTERCKDGEQCVSRFSNSAPGEFQAILMDIQMPVMNGLDATRAIRALSRPDAACIPIIAMTANSFQEDVDAARAAGMNGFVSKPLDVNYLYRLLYDLLK